MQRIILFVKAPIMGLLLSLLFSDSLFAQQDTSRNDYYWVFSDSIGIDWMDSKNPTVFSAPIYSYFQNTCWSFRQASEIKCLFSTDTAFYNPTPYGSQTVTQLRMLNNKPGYIVPRVAWGIDNGLFIGSSSFAFPTEYHYACSKTPRDTIRKPAFVTLGYDTNLDLDSLKTSEINTTLSDRDLIGDIRDGEVLSSMVALKSALCNQWFICRHSYEGNRFSFIDRNHAVIIEEFIGQKIIPIPNEYQTAKVILNRNGTRIGLISRNGFAEVFDLDRCNLRLTSLAYFGIDSLYVKHIRPPNHFYSGTFSQDGTKLYVNTADSIFQFDFTRDTRLTDKKTVATLNITLSRQIFSDLELAPDGKVYVNIRNIDLLPGEKPKSDAWLGVIAFPDSHVSKCGYSEKGLNIGKRRMGWRFPYIVNNRMRPLTPADMGKIFPYPSVTICPNTAIRLGPKDEPTDESEYEWIIDNQYRSYLKDIEKQSSRTWFSAPRPGTYKIRLKTKVKSDCFTPVTVEDEVTIIVRADSSEPCLTVSRPELIDKNKDRFTLYPNPSDGSFSVKIETELKERLLLEVLNPIGQTILTRELTPLNGQASSEMDLHSVSEGLYIIRLSRNGQTLTTRKIIVN